MRFVTLFPATENVHLTKDVGCIPYMLHKEYGYDSKIVTFNNGGYPYIRDYLPGLKIEFLKKGNERLRCLEFVYKHAKEIDVLNMYHMSLGKSLLCMYIYKKINRSGITYLKLDMDLRTIKIIESYSPFKKKLIRKMIKHVDIVSAESTDIASKMEYITNHKIEYIPNGILEYSANKTDTDLNSKKKNIFLTVGRLGSEQKSTEVLVDAFVQIYKKTDWVLYLVGTWENNFKDFIDKKISEYPELKDKIILTGAITDKDKLTEIYQSAKIFVLPSKWESFGLVTVEAMVNGCRLLLSDQVSPADDFKKLGNFCHIVEFGNIKQLADEMLNMSKTTYDANQIAKVAVDNFLWTGICEKINDFIVGN